MRGVDIGALVTADLSDSPSIVDLAHVAKLRLVLFAPDYVASTIKPGQGVNFTIDALPGEIFQQKVSRTARLLESDTRRMRVEVDVPNQGGRFFPGMFAKVTLTLSKPSNAVSIPARAVRVEAEGAYVYVVIKDTLAKRPVSILSDTGATALITGDVKPGTAVVVSSSTPLKDGQPAQIAWTPKS